MAEYISSIHKIPIYDSQGYIELYDLSRSNENQNARIQVVTTIASASFGKNSSKSPSKLYEKLFNENNTILEFIRLFPNYGIQDSLRNNIHAEFSSSAYDVHNDHVACIKFRAPLMVIAHIVRHRSFSYNQCSRRYTKVTIDDIFMPDILKRQRGQEIIQDTIDYYNHLIESKSKPEEARTILPAYLIMSDMWMIGNRKAWKSLFNIRLHNKNEKVLPWTKELVQSMYDIILKFQPKVVGEK